MDAFCDYECILQYTVLSYRIDLYLPKVKLAVECDEFNHWRYNLEAEDYLVAGFGLFFLRPDPKLKVFLLWAIFSISAFCLLASASSVLWCCDVLTAFVIAALSPAKAPRAPSAAKSIGTNPPVWLYFNRS